jgi:hypothetical protein
MYHVQFTNPNRQAMGVMLRNGFFLESYIDGLMYTHDLICDLQTNRQEHEFSPEAIQENMARLMKPDVYVSYSTRDRLEHVMYLSDTLRNNGINTWNWLPGTYMPESNWDAHQKHSTCFVAVVSPQTKNSEWVLHEWAQARNLQMPSMVVLMEETDRRYIPHELKDAQIIGFDRHQGNPLELIQAIRKIMRNHNHSHDQLPFEVVDNLRQNYEAARRIYLLAVMPQYSFPIEARQRIREMLEDGSLDLQNTARRFIVGLTHTYTALLTFEREIDFE